MGRKRNPERREVNKALHQAFKARGVRAGAMKGYVHDEQRRWWAAKHKVAAGLSYEDAVDEVLHEEEEGIAR